ncbi:translation initiation factor IF-2-like [Corvus hawaiiensis]|uniref:translation initiation factor IF-2-like n=1 Tax=Corvus hawaiiensis TaxID=134902 RepID=UPI0020194DA1|nr:translation initiation factor IF-2-like [Corvus hawaiiensis]
MTLLKKAAQTPPPKSREMTPNRSGTPSPPPVPTCAAPGPSCQGPRTLPPPLGPVPAPPPGVPEPPAAPPGDPDSPAAPGVGGGSRRVLFADALGLPLTRLRQYRPWDPRGRGGPPGGGGEGPLVGGEGGAVGEPPPPGIWMRPGKGRPQEAEDVQPPPPDHSTEPDPAPTPPPDVEQPPAQGAEDEAVARELEQLYLSHLRRLRGDPGDSDPPPRNGGPPFPERAPNTSLANEMALRYEGGGRCSPPVLLGRGGAGGGGAGGAGAAPPGAGDQFGGGPQGVRGGLGFGRAGAGGLGGRGGPHGRAGPGALPGTGLAHVRGGGEAPLSPPKIVTSQIVTAPPPPPFHP